MKDLIVFYSLEGNTKYVVDKIKSGTGAECLELVPKKAYLSKGFMKFVWGGKSAVMGEKPELEDYDVDLSQYDRIIFGFPVWAATYTPPLRTFVSENIAALKGKRFAAFACQSGNGAEKAFEKLAYALGDIEFEETAIFIDPKTKSCEETDKQITTFCQILQGNRI